MAAKHEIIVELVRLLMTQKGARVFKNAMGTGLVGEKLRPVKFGVCNPGGSDLIGWRPVRITPEMVGQTLAQFVAVECKTPGDKARPAQVAFLRAAVRSGGVAMIARRVGDDGIEFEEIQP
jgi:hypothetical protein